MSQASPPALEFGSAARCRPDRRAAGCSQLDDRAGAAAQRRVPALSSKTFNRLVISGVALGFATLLGVGLFAGYIVSLNIEDTRAVAHTYEVREALAEVRLMTERVETARRGYMLEHDPQFRQTYRLGSMARQAVLAKVERLTADNPRQRANIARLRDVSARQAAAQEHSMQVADRDRAAAPLAFDLDPAVALTRELRGVTQAMDAEEARLLEARDAARTQSVNNLILVLTLGGVLLILVGAGSIFVILQYTQDLTASRDALRKLNEGLEDQVNSRTSDLQRANDEIQRFAYIVSHDLRSPLVNVMGFTSELEAAAKPLSALLDRAEAEAPEIVSEDAWHAVRTDLPEAVGFIRSSTQKMDRLINAILQLSRQGRRVLTPELIDTRALFEGIADALKHRSVELGASIEIPDSLPTIVSDRVALDQVFSNLVENALKYLRPGVPGHIQIRATQHGGRVIYEIIDNGRGIDPKDHERVFDLFRRSGAQDQPGEGIGLAHVRALAYRLGGTVSVESALDQGATFRVSLPISIAPEGSVA
jgi:signal transduction histidine kinase